MSPHHPDWPTYERDIGSIRCFAHAMAIVAAGALLMLAWEAIANRADDDARIRAGTAETVRQIEAAAK